MRLSSRNDAAGMYVCMYVHIIYLYAHIRVLFVCMCIYLIRMRLSSQNDAAGMYELGRCYLDGEVSVLSEQCVCVHYDIMYMSWEGVTWMVR